MPNLMVISGYSGMMPVIEQSASFLGIEPDIFDWEFANQDLIERLKEKFAADGEPTVIIGRGGIASIVEKNFPNIIVLRSEPDDLDILEALEKAKPYGDRIGMLLHDSISRNYKVEALRRILDLKELRIYTFSSVEDIRQRIRDGKADGMQAMVGGGTLGRRTGLEVGIPSFFVGTSRRAMERVMIQAISIINSHRRSQLERETFRTTTALVSEGVLIVEKDSILLANDEMLHILNTDEAYLLNHSLDSLIGVVLEKSILDFFSDPYVSEAVLTINGKNYLVRKKGSTEERLTAVFRNVEEIQQQEQHVRSALKAKGLTAKFTFDDITGTSQKIHFAKEKAAFYASTDANILICGKSGTGKELFAQSIHNASFRRLKPFVAVNCAAIPETLLESELFGYEDGAFSGAKRGGHRGLFEISQGGTLFLDEIDSIPFHLQGALLRAIQEKEIRRVGSRQILSIDVRIISATNQNMHEMISGGAFRADLYYRLNTLNIQIPSLEERREDILPLAEQFLNRYAQKYHCPVPVLSEQDKAILLREKWLGNVRALENVIHRFVILRGKQTVSIGQCLTEEVSEPISTLSLEGAKEMIPQKGSFTVPAGNLEDMERELILSALKCNWGNQTATAAQLGISRATLWKKLKCAKEISISTENK